MNLKVKSDFDLDINIIPQYTAKEERLIDRLLQDIRKIDIYEYLKGLGWKASYTSNGEYKNPKQKELKVGLIEYLLELAKNKEWKIIKK